MPRRRRGRQHRDDLLLRVALAYNVESAGKEKENEDIVREIEANWFARGLVGPSVETLVSLCDGKHLLRTARELAPEQVARAGKDLWRVERPFRIWGTSYRYAQCTTGLLLGFGATSGSVSWPQWRS